MQGNQNYEVFNGGEGRGRKTVEVRYELAKINGNSGARSKLRGSA